MLQLTENDENIYKQFTFKTISNPLLNPFSIYLFIYLIENFLPSITINPYRVLEKNSR